jgi:hypothetical protein
MPGAVHFQPTTLQIRISGRTSVQTDDKQCHAHRCNDVMHCLQQPAAQTLLLVHPHHH